MLGRVHNALGGAIPQTPPGFYPSGSQDQIVAELQARATMGLAQALTDVTEDFASAHMSPPVAASVPLLKAIVSSSAGMDLTALASGAGVAPSAAGNVVKAVADVLDGALELVAAFEVGQSAAAAVTSAAEAIPVVSAIVTWVVDAVSAVVAAAQGAPQKQVAAEVEQVLYDKLRAECASRVKQDAPYGTLVGGRVSPADFFRKVAYRYYQTGDGPTYTVPFNAASMYVALCGGETQGFFQTRDDWNALIARAKQRTAAERTQAEADKLGIPGDVQRTMWRLIKGIFTMVQPPISAYHVPDQGRTLMPMLQDLVRETYLKGQWNDIVAQEMSNAIAATESESASKKIPGGAGGTVQRSATCAGGKYGFPAFVDLSQPFIDSIVQYEAALLESFYDASTNTWSVRPTAGNVVIGGKRGAIVLSPAQLQSLSDSLDRATGKRGWFARNFVGLLTAGVGAAGGYYAARRYGWFGA
jgi:hypothetical protein